MEVVHTRCAGIDISKRDAKVAVRIARPGRLKAETEVRTFGSSTPRVLELRDWLVASRVTCAVMEATGDYWRIFYYLLEDAGIELLLANPTQVKNRKGRKSDVSDARWLAELGAFGLVDGSFVPPPPIRDLRALTRLRIHMAQDRAKAAQRLEKVLEDAGIKLAAVASHIDGVSSRLMLAALSEGRAVDDMVQLAYGTLRSKSADLTDALTGQFTARHAMMTKMLLDRIDACQTDIDTLTAAIDTLMQPYRQAHDLLLTIPGVSDRVADVVIAETGGDMTQFPSAKHLAAWAGVAPGSNQSGTLVKPAKTLKGDTYLKGALGIVALSAMRHNDTYLSAQYRRIAARRGSMKAMVAVENTVTTAIWYMLTRNEPYQDPGHDYFTRRRPESAKANAITQLQNLGYKVTLTPLPDNHG